MYHKHIRRTGYMCIGMSCFCFGYHGCLSCLAELKSNHGVSDVGRSVGSNDLSICLGDTMMRLTYVVGCVLELVGLGCMEWKGPATIEDS